MMHKKVLLIGGPESGNWVEWTGPVIMVPDMPRVLDPDLDPDSRVRLVQYEVTSIDLFGRRLHVAFPSGTPDQEQYSLTAKAVLRWDVARELEI